MGARRKSCPPSSEQVERAKARRFPAALVRPPFARSSASRRHDLCLRVTANATRPDLGRLDNPELGVSGKPVTEGMN
jgi:hypothetical protein